jgi:large subunit ribosomal protein L22
MQFVAKARYIRYSPYKLRQIADVIRGKTVPYAQGWLSLYPVHRTVPVKKVLDSAVANARHGHNVGAEKLVIKEIRIDQGPLFRYFKPGAMGRANIYRKRQSHIYIILESVDHLNAKKEV